MFCPECGKTVDQKERRCPSCAAPLPADFFGGAAPTVPAADDLPHSPPVRPASRPVTADAPARIEQMRKRTEPSLGEGHCQVCWNEVSENSVEYFSGREMQDAYYSGFTPNNDVWRDLGASHNLADSDEYSYRPADEDPAKRAFREAAETSRDLWWEVCPSCYPTVLRYVERGHFYMKRWRFWCWLLGEAAGMGAALGYFRLRLMQDDLETDLWLGTGLALGGALGGGLAGAIVGSVVGKIADFLEHEPGVIYWILVLVGAVASVCLGWELHADEQGWQWWTWRAGSAAVGMASAGLLCGLLALARKGR